MATRIIGDVDISGRVNITNNGTEFTLDMEDLYKELVGEYPWAVSIGRWTLPAGNDTSTPSAS